MIYNELFKEQIKNLYFNERKIGKIIFQTKDLDFLNKHIDKKKELKPDIYILSEILQAIISEYKDDRRLKNIIGLSFLESLILKEKILNFLISLNRGVKSL